MKTSSCKAKARRLQDFVVETIYKSFSQLREGDVKPAIMGESGKDIKFSPAAEDIIPFDIECKNTEGFSRNSAIKQAEVNSKQNRIPIVVFKKNRSKTYSIISLENLIKIVDNI